MQALIEEGLIKRREELASRPDLVEEIHWHWLQQPQVGCRFAQALAHDSAKYGWGVICHPLGEGPQQDIALAAQEITTEVVSAAEIGMEALSILLPGLEYLKSMCALALKLSELEDWSFRCGAPHVGGPHLESYALFGLDFLLPEGIPSAALGLGPSSALPLTRQAPIYSLQVRPISKNADEPKHRHGVPLVSHLAQIAYPESGQLAKKEDRTWQSTTALRQSVLGWDDYRARAEVTFAFPWDLWKDCLRGT